MIAKARNARPGTARYLVRFAYDGSGFAGWARQPGQRTIEGEILAGLVRIGVAPDLRSASVSVASRTDRGVHARGNALTIESALPPLALLRAINGISPEIRFSQAALVPQSFRARSAAHRWYRYFDRPARRVPRGWSDAARRLEGRIDIRSFARGVPSALPVWRTVDSIIPRIDSGWLILDVRARAFAWGMVRKLVTALRHVESGRLTIEALSEAARGRRRLALPLAEPDRLVLWEVEYPVPWTWSRPSFSGNRAREIRAAQVSASARARILIDLARDLDPAGPTRPDPAPSKGTG